MSRIHEALKKAELERATAQAGEAPALQPELVLPVEPAAPARGIRDAIAQAASISVPASGYLRLEDLVSESSHPRWNPDPHVNVFFKSEAGGHGAEQFRTLRSRLYQLRATLPLRKLLITSSIPAEGKTFVATNLAQAIVRQPGRHALLIDCDLRCPRIHVPLGASLAPGLADYLRGEANEKAVIQKDENSGLCIITGGKGVKDPSELLSNGRLKTLLERVTPLFDWVILDSPPCLPVADANILSDMCDGVLMVVGAGTTPSEVAQRACQEFRERNLVGVVLNRGEHSKGYAGYYYSYGTEYGRNAGKQS